MSDIRINDDHEYRANCVRYSDLSSSMVPIKAIPPASNQVRRVANTGPEKDLMQNKRSIQKKKRDFRGNLVEPNLVVSRAAGHGWHRLDIDGICNREIDNIACHHITRCLSTNVQQIVQTLSPEIARQPHIPSMFLRLLVSSRLATP